MTGGAKVFDGEKARQMPFYEHCHAANIQREQRVRARFWRWFWACAAVCWAVAAWLAAN